jgi:diguanylate cyclase (GGDEF)-like protein
MTSRKKPRITFMIIAALIIFLLISGGTFSILSQQAGNARVVNYIGIVRGGTQKLIKEELYGQPDDALIARLDGIVAELISGQGDNELIALPDSAFQGTMQRIKVMWADLKLLITGVRAGEDNVALYELSQEYFDLTNTAVFEAEAYSEFSVGRSRVVLLLVSGSALVLFIGALVYYLRLESTRKRAERLDKLAHDDTLTGIPNRLQCEKVCNTLDKQKPSYNICVFMFDMNNLKETNDFLGHKAGDELIREFAKLLKAWARDSNAFVGRYGGDEFLAVFKDIGMEDARAKLSKIYSMADTYNEQAHSDYEKLSFASGFAINNLNLVPMEILIIDADRFMYERKRQMRIFKHHSET